MKTISSSIFLEIGFRGCTGPPNMSMSTINKAEDLDGVEDGDEDVRLNALDFGCDDTGWMLDVNAAVSITL